MRHPSMFLHGPFALLSRFSAPSFVNEAEARLAVFAYLEGWYNPRRRHSALDHLSPIAFEKRELVPA